MFSYASVFMRIVLILVLCQSIRGDSVHTPSQIEKLPPPEESQQHSANNNEPAMPIEEIVKNGSASENDPKSNPNTTTILQNTTVKPLTKSTTLQPLVDGESPTKINIEINVLPPDRNTSKPFNIPSNSSPALSTDLDDAHVEKLAIVTKKPKGITSTIVSVPVEPPYALFHLTKSNFDNFVINSSKVWIVAFYSKGCDNCTSAMNLLREAAKNLSEGNVTVGIVDVGEEKELKDRFMVSEVPSTKLFYPGDTGGYVYHGPLTDDAIYKASTADESARIFPSIMDGRHVPINVLNDSNNFGNNSMALQNADSGKSPNRTYLEPNNSGSSICIIAFWKLLVFYGAVEQIFQSTLVSFIKSFLSLQEIHDY